MLPWTGREGVLAVDHVTLDVHRGEVFGLVGPNGAGKTTLIKMLSTLILPTAGSAQINGYDLSDEIRVKASIGLVVGDERSFYWRLSCRDNLRFYAGLQNLSPAQAEQRIAELARLLGLDEFLDKRFDACSTGMKHRLALARGLLHDPQILFLDEPTKSLDPLAAAHFHETVRLLARHGRTIFLVTHDLSEATELCQRVGVMLRGRVRVTDEPSRLRTLANAQGWDEVFESLPAETSEGAATETAAMRPSSPEETTPPAPDGMGGEGSFPTAGTIIASLSKSLHKPLLFLRRDLQMNLSYRLSFILQFLGILFSIASFYFIGRLFGGRVAPQLSEYGGDYFSFALIGIAFVGYQGVALYAFSSVIQSAQAMGTLEAMLVTPTRLSTVLVSSNLWNLAFTSFRVALYLAAGILLFGADLQRANLLSGFVILFLTILALSGIGVLSASFIMVFKRGDPFNFVIGSLSSLLGGVYYPIEVLPEWLQTLARLFPLTYSLEAMRRALLAGESLTDLRGQIAALTAFAAILLPLSLLVFRYAVRQAKKDGSLTQY